VQIIDGFGSYVNDFMKCDVFRGIGGTAHKYYLLFQHHLPPPASTYTSDAVPSASVEEGQGVDPNQAMGVFVHPAMSEPNYIYGPKSGVSASSGVLQSATDRTALRCGAFPQHVYPTWR
jgi:hypothetical protein